MKEKQYFRPGTSNEVKVDVRILASATVDLDAALADGADFYFYYFYLNLHDFICRRCGSGAKTSLFILEMAYEA
jgi:transcriptional regulator of aromatic amino acid metabolism